jgi:hypothetical protein
MMKRLLIPVIVLATLASAPSGHALNLDGSRQAADGLRKLAARALPANFDKEQAAEYAKQTTWLKNAAGRCDALAKKMQAAGSKSANVGKVIEKGAATEWPNLRGALQKENGEFSFGSQQAKARQQEAKQLLESLGQ